MARVCVWPPRVRTPGANTMTQPRAEPADHDGRYFDDRDEDFDDWECDRCHGDGMDPWCDYLMPCPACQGEQHT